MNESRSAPELLSVHASRWDVARRYLPVIQRLGHSSHRTTQDVIAASVELACGPAHIYRLLRRYLADPRLTSLLPRRRGTKDGHSYIQPEVEALINDAIEEVYLTRQRPRVMDLVAEVRRRCRALGLTPPGRKAITKRLQARPQSEVLARREGRKTARDRVGPVTGSLEADWPLSLVQIDHTLVDVIVVDSVSREQPSRM
jgi:putative transposase